MILRASNLRLTCATCTLLTMIFITSVLVYFETLPSKETLLKYAHNISTGVADFRISSSLSSSACPRDRKPNLILSSMDGAKWQDQIYKFMESLEISLAKDMLWHQRGGERLPAPVNVKIIVPPETAEDLSPSFLALIDRYPHLSFPGFLPELDQPSVLTRFIGWSNLINEIGHFYSKVLIMDLDIIFQRNPFSSPLLITANDNGVDLLFFKEWTGMKLGQQKTHYDWHHGCMSSPGGPDNSSYESEAQFASYATHEIICDGTTLGTTQAISVYLRMMAHDIQATEFGCNDQAMHQHIFYSGLLQDSLSSAGLGDVIAIPNEESEIVGTIGWVPYVRYNHFGEILSDSGEVQAVVHQFKAHPKLVQMVNHKYAWFADPGEVDAPDMPALVESQAEVATDVEEWAGIDTGAKPKFKQFTSLEGVTDANCTRSDDLCSCWFQGCHVDYGPHLAEWN